MDNTIAILLATYNGEKYLSEQLDSLLSQTLQDIKIYIRDDGSSDDTLKIIEDYCTKHGDKIEVINDSINHRGPKMGFMQLLKTIDAPYYMFCDQDDYWHKDKVEKSYLKITEMSKQYPETPLMVHTDLRVVDKDLSTIHPSFWKFSKFNVDLNKKSVFTPFGNVFTGCTMIFNDALKKHLFPIPPEVPMHDFWVGLVAAKHGKVDNIKESLIDYRQHGENVCSTGSPKKFKLKKVLCGPRWYKELKPLLDAIQYGSKFKAVFYKNLYSLVRVFYHN